MSEATKGPGFTPGPWRLSKLPPTVDRYVLGPDMREVAAVAEWWPDGTMRMEFGDNCVANARLIAAAPDMYEALKEGWELMAKVEESALVDTFYDGREVEKWCGKARAALRAAGED